MSRISAAMLRATKGSNMDEQLNRYTGNGDEHFVKRPHDWIAIQCKVDAFIREFDYPSRYGDMETITDDLRDLARRASAASDRLEAQHNAATERGESDRQTCNEAMRSSRAGDAKEANFFREGLR